MKTFSQGGYQKYLRYIFLVLIAILILFGLTPSKTIKLADSNLALEVINSVTVLDSYFSSRSGDSYGLHVFVKTNASFIPIQIRFSTSGIAYRMVKLTPNPNQLCPFADNKIRKADIIDALQRGNMLAYDSDSIPGSGLANAYPKSVDLIIEVRGELFLVQGVDVSGECFWAQE